MRFLRSKDIQLGMRTAKPIYNREGVLLYGRNTIVTESFITNITNLDIYGLYILEPQEPVPPISEWEEEFERFQTRVSYLVKTEIDKAVRGDDYDISEIVEDIIRSYGRLKDKIRYVQIIRSNEDYAYKHALSVAILCAIICKKMDMDPKEQKYIVSAALLHDLGKVICPNEILYKEGKLEPDELSKIKNSELEGYTIIRENMLLSAGIRRYITQLYIEACNKIPGKPKNEQKLLLGTQIIKVADMFDVLTAMRVYKEPMSEFSAIGFFEARESEFKEEIVLALASSIDVLPVGACVELTNGEKGLVLAESEYFLLRPRVLGFSSNTIYDLSQRKTYDQVKIKDIMKTTDNRFVMQNK